MKFKSLLLLAFAALLAVAAPRPARAAEVSFDFFYHSLSPYGEWIQVGDYGYCWRPGGVDEDWAPYADGYWAYTDAGWTWVSYEEFGGIVYHYGRWVKVEDVGWCWVPDYEWGPAWVSWRRSDDYVGWAPLPAEARWQPERGFSVWVDTSYDIGPGYYNFCRIHDFGAPVLRPVILSRTENIVIIANTVNITNITFNSRAGVVFNGGLDYVFVNRFARRPIPALKLVRNQNVTVVNNNITINNVRVTNINAVQKGNQLTVIAPAVVRPQQAQLAALMQPKVTKVIAQQKVTKGWAGVAAEKRTELKAKLAQETQGLTPESSPAKPLKAAELKVVPLKADPNAKVASVPSKLLNADVPKTEKLSKIPGVPPAAEAIPTPGPTEGAKTAREKMIGKKPVNELPPGVVKPFKPEATTGGNAGAAATPFENPAIEKHNAAIEKRNAAVEAAKNKAAAQEAVRERTTEQNQQQQEIMRRNKAADAAEAKQRTLQQQEQQEQVAARKRVLDQQQMQQQQSQQQQILRERAAQSAAAKQHALELQQSQARQKPQIQQQQNMPPGTVQKAPGKPGKRPLTPEEIEQLKRNQQ